MDGVCASDTRSGFSGDVSHGEEDPMILSTWLTSAQRAGTHGQRRTPSTRESEVQTKVDERGARKGDHRL